MTTPITMTPLPRTLPEDPFFSVYDSSKSTLVLRAAKELRDRSWAAWFGPIQKSLKEKIWLNDNTKPIYKCVINLIDCEWADPAPLLSLSITLLEYEDNEHHVKIIFPSDKQSDQQNTKSGLAKKRFLRFLAREGFLHQLSFPEPTLFLKRATFPREVVIGHHQYTEDNRKTYDEETIQKENLGRFQELGTPLIFEDCTALPSIILELENPEKNTEILNLIDGWVEEVLFEILDSVIRDRVPSWAQSGIKYRLLMSLRETLHNVAEHAYVLNGYAGIYIRYRAGALSKEITPEIKDAIEREESNSGIPIRRGENDSPFVYYRSGFFEMFVIDSGNGILKTISVPHKSIDSVNKAMRAIFDDGMSRKNKKKRITDLGGLHLLAQILSPVNDHILILDNDDWWGAQLPLPSETQKSFTVDIAAGGADPAYYSGKKDSDNKEIYIEKPNGPGIVQGFCWISRHSWLQDTAVKRDKDPWAVPNKSNIVEALLHEYTVETIEYTSTIDVRIQTFEKIYRNLENECRSILFLPGSRWMRSKIQSEIARAINAISISNKFTLIIGDILPEEAHTFLAATRSAYGLTKPEFDTIQELILITRDLKVAVLKRLPNKLFAPSPSASEQFIKFNPDKFCPEKSLTHYLRALRSHDSKRIWDVVDPKDEEVENTAFRQVEVEWHNDTSNNLVLNGYLDFAQSLTHPICREIYFLSLHRIFVLYRSIYTCDIRSMDSLVESTIIRFNADVTTGHSPPEGLNNCQIFIGSILVSGQTGNTCPNNCKTVYFFSHPSGPPKNNKRLLCWLGGITSLQFTPPRYRRIGRTPMIALDGWKAYRIPRFNKFGISAYVKSPKDSYKVWQEPSRSLMKFGHWNYGGHHDLLTINLMLAFDTELDKVSLAIGSSVARFLFANFFQLFSITNAHLTENGKRILNAIESEIGSLEPYLLPKQLARKKPLLIYPSHAVTDHVINRFISLINDTSKLKEVRSRLRGILPVRRHRSGSGMQVSGLVLEWLDAKANEKKRKSPPPAVIFDDAIISGRTYHDIKGLLRVFGFENIYSIAMLDRQRLPSTEHINSGKRTCYWRLDVPTLGGDDHCPLCHALSRAKAFQIQLAFPDLVSHWITDWETKNPATEWGNTGLRPTYLKLNKLKRKFGIEPVSKGSPDYRQIGSDSEQVSITNSAGLVCWMTEMHANTARDDLSTTFPEREPNLSPLVKIQLLSSQLLLFMGEFDTAQAHRIRLAIFEALWNSEIPVPDMATSLGVLSLLASDTNSLKEAAIRFCSIKGKGLLNGRNTDFVLLIAYCISQGLLEDSPIYAAASRLLRSNKTRADIYYRFHRETMDVSGSAHSPPLRRLIKAGAPLNIKGLIQYNTIEASLKQIVSLLDELSEEWLNISLLKENISNSNLTNSLSISDFRNHAKALMELITETGASIEIEGVESIHSNEKFHLTKSSAEIFLEHAENFHKSLFRPLQIDLLKNGKICNVNNFVENSINDLNKELIQENRRTFKVITQPLTEIKLKENLTEYYIPWDTDIASEIRRILSNIRHSSKNPIRCPFYDSYDSEKYHAWILISFDVYKFKLTIVNAPSENYDQRKRPSYHHIFSDFRGNVEYIYYSAKNIVTTTASWAFAHALGDIR